MKVKSKISYLCERNSILPEQMAEQLAVEVDVIKTSWIAHTHGQSPLFGSNANMQLCDVMCVECN